MDEPRPGSVPLSPSSSSPPAVTLHSSWRGLVLSALGAGAMFSIGVFSVARGGWGVFSTGVVVIGLLLAAVTLLDYPVATSFDSSGLTRRMMLRRHSLSWSSIDQLSRTRPSTVKNLRKLAHGGLVAVRGRRRFLLVDQCESAAEFALVDALAVDGDRQLAETVPRPSEEVPPTWIHRRARWAPTSTDHR